MNIIEVSDDAVDVVVAEDAGDAATDLVLGLWRSLSFGPPSWLVRAQPTYTRVHVVFDPAVDVADVRAYLEKLRPQPRLGPQRIVEVNVRYAGPDLDDVAQLTGLSIDEVIHRHSCVSYRVAFCGFVKGFAYLLGLDEKLRVPRLAEPRPRVPAGSVGLAGDQTGLYPSSTPGGWRLIAQATGIAHREFKDGWVSPDDVVRFVPC